MANDWDKPDNSTVYTSVLSDLRAELASLGKMDFTGDSNIPTDFIRWNATNKYMEKYNGATWDRLISAADARTVLELGSLATLSSINNSNWSGAALAIANGGTGATTQSAARTALGLDALATKATVNNDDWSGTDLAITNGGTGGSDAGTARANLGLGTLATRNNINDGDWSGTELSIANGGTGGTSQATARANLDVAKRGANSDLTSLTNVNTLERTGGPMTIGPTDNKITLQWSNNAYIEGTGSIFRPVTDRAVDLGDSTHGYNGFHVDTINFRGTYSGSAKDPSTTAEDGWIDVQVGGVTAHVPYWL